MDRVGGGGGRRPRGPAQGDAEYVPLKKTRGQRPIDFYSSAIRHLVSSPYIDPSMALLVPPHEYYAKDVLPPSATPFNPSAALCTQWAHTSQYPEDRRQQQRGGFRPRRPQFTNVVWSPSGRKLLCTASNGEFIVLNGQSFAADHKTTAHEDGKMCRAVAWSGLTDCVLSGDDGGVAKIWGANLQLAAEFDCNQRALRAVEWAPSERRFCTAGQDGTVRIWDTDRVVSSSGATPEIETKLEGHGGDVICVKWHPSRALIATGSQDKCMRLWDPRAGVENQLAVLQGHTEPVMSLQWNPCGHEWQLLSGGRDSMARLWDTRMLRQLCAFAGHTGDVNGVSWHPSVPTLFATAGADGLLAYWTTDGATAAGATSATGSASSGPQEISKWLGAVPSAHDQRGDKPNPITGCAWSPLGHVLASYSSEVIIWARNKPGAVEEMRYQNDDAADLVIPSAGEGAGLGAADSANVVWA